ncbi:MAG: ribonuclease HII [Patescibacteria group bacterium]
MIIGVDEAGRGCMAGPLVAAAVCLDGPIHGLSDSKRLSPAARERLMIEVQSQACSIGIGWVPAAQVDEIGLTQATSSAMRQAVRACKATLPSGRSIDQIIIDGNYNYLEELDNVETVIKADAKHPEVMAASIIAKVSRDAYMKQLSKRYPEYGFEKHFGYVTPGHIEACRESGPIPGVHRYSYKTIKDTVSDHG